MKRYYLAVDIGASGGRHILGSFVDGKLFVEEVYRFETGAILSEGSLVWDTDAMFGDILRGLKLCGEIGKRPASMGVDSWAADCVLLDSESNRIGKTYAYRDARTQGLDAELGKIIDPQDLYRRTGIQKIPFNSIYQLLALKRDEPEVLKRASAFLLLPDYFHFRLTGKINHEYTNATTTQLVDARSRDWDEELLAMLGLDRSLFGHLSFPGDRLGAVKAEYARMLGSECQVVLPVTHDTGSAVMSIPAMDEDVLYISSGTWSLMGCELKEPITSPESMALNFTNEGGYGNRYRFLMNIMGLWMLQSVRKEFPDAVPYEELVRLAEQSPIDTLVDCNDPGFFAPQNMITAIQSWCAERGLQSPVTTGELAAVVLRSLAACYSRTLGQIEKITGKKFKAIHVMGGGSKNVYLNQLTANATGLPVFAGPVEATAVGNLLAQMIADGVFSGLEEARRCVADSFNIVEYYPKDKNSG